ncbi:MAG: hypothetical protein AB8G05_02740 [Oligoflexales bacterium]
MDNFLKQLETALQFYIARGKAAIEQLELNNWEKASIELRNRKAAFLNYRAADSLTHENLGEYYKSETARMMWEQIESQEMQISMLLKKYKKRYADQLGKIKKEKSRISKYRSQSQNQNTFARSI